MKQDFVEGTAASIFFHAVGGSSLVRNVLCT